MPTIRQRGDSFQAIVRVKRDGVIVHSEAQTFPTRRLAADWGKRVEAQIAERGVPARQLRSKTLGELMGEHLEKLLVHDKLRRTKVSEIEQLVPHFIQLPLTRVGEAIHFTKFAEKRRADGAGPSTVLHNLSTVRSILNAAKAMHGLEVDGSGVADAISALTRANVVAKSSQRDRRPTRAEIDMLLDEFRRVATHPSAIIPMADIVELAVAWPRRLGELCDMRWVDYNKDRSIMVLRDTKHPTRPRDEIVPMTPAGRIVLARLPVVDERVLPYKSESISASFERACKRLGILDLRFHDLRHEGISRLFEKGLSIPEVATISGHLSWQMLRRYTHLSASALVEKLNAGFDQAQKDSS